MKKISIILLALMLGLGLAGEAIAQKGKAAPKVDENAQYIPEELRDALNFAQKVDGEWAQYVGLDNVEVSPENMEAVRQKIAGAGFEFPSVTVMFFSKDKESGDSAVYLILKNTGSTELQSFAIRKDAADEAKAEVAFDYMTMASYVTTPEKIFAEHNENILAAENKFEDLIFTVLATVNKIGKDSDGNYFIELNTPTPVQQTVIYHLDEEQQEDAGKLKPGDAIAIEARLEKCDSDGVVLGGGGYIMTSIPGSRLNMLPTQGGQPGAVAQVQSRPREFTRSQANEIESCLRAKKLVETTGHLAEVGGMAKSVQAPDAEATAKTTSDILTTAKKREAERCAGISDEVIAEYQAWQAAKRQELMSSN
jgi:hypothetical protein